MNKFAFTSIVAISALSVFADLSVTRIAPVAAYAPNSASKTSPSGVINGSGLSDSGGHTSSNGASSNTPVWYSSGAPSWFVMDLGAVYSVSALKFWNYNGSKNTNRGLKNIDVLFSVETDAYSSGVDFDNGKWTVVKSIDELGKAPGSDGWTGNDPITLTAPQSARFIGIRINSTWGATEGGLSEFRADVVRSVSMDSASVSSTTAATLSGTMATTDAADGEVFLAYGDTNGGTNVLAWSSVVSCGARSPGESFSKVLDDLTPGKSYVGSFYVYDHSVAANWSAATNFITGVVSVTMPPDFCEAETAAKHIVFSRPAGCAAGTLAVSYSLSGDAASDYAAALPGSIVFAAGATEAAVHTS